jgi:hypothetical protein
MSPSTMLWPVLVQKGRGCWVFASPQRILGGKGSEVDVVFLFFFFMLGIKHRDLNILG